MPSNHIQVPAGRAAWAPWNQRDGVNSFWPGRLIVPNEISRVLVINPGSTSTKFGVFTRNGAEWVSVVRHGDDELEQFRGRSALTQA